MMSNTQSQIILKDNAGEDLFGNWMIQRYAELQKKECLGFIEKYIKETAGQYVNWLELQSSLNQL